MRSRCTFRFLHPARLNRSHSVKSALHRSAGGSSFGTARALTRACTCVGKLPLFEKGAAPGGAPASPLGYASPPLPHSCHGFGLRPNRASPGPFLQVLQKNSLAVGRGGRGRVVSAYAYTHRIPRPPGHGASISQARCPRPRPPPGNRGSSRSNFLFIALRNGRPAATLRGKWSSVSMPFDNWS